MRSLSTWFVSALMLCGLAGASPAMAQENPVRPLDADGNGLYDDAERFAVLEKLQQLYPELQAEGMFDTNSDDRVTIQEMAEGRHPITVVMIEPWRKREKELAERPDARIPWAVDLFPEWIMSAYFQEDAPVGAAAGELKARGILPLAGQQEDAARQFRKTAERGGIEFPAGAFYQLPGQRDSRWNYRWLAFTFRIDGKSAARDQTNLVDINANGHVGAGRSTPRIWYDRETGLNVQYVGINKGGQDIRRMAGKNVVADGKTWNVLVAGVRQGRMFASLNGTPLATEKEQPSRFAYDMVYGPNEQRDPLLSFIGDRDRGAAVWALDALVLGQTEISEAMARKLEGWGAHRLGVAANLPHGHPYMIRRPAMDGEDFPYRYYHDDAKWVDWGSGLTKAKVRANAGKPRVAPASLGFERVFSDDFRADRVTLSTSGVGDLWQAFGFNTAVGAAAQLLPPGRTPNIYIHDAANQTQILSMQYHKPNKRWYSGTFYSVNDNNQGYTWTGPKVFRIRCMLPDEPKDVLGAGLWPAFWSYGTEWLNWRTSNRIETDYFEHEGADARYLNGLSTHFHYPHVKTFFAKNQNSYKRFKVYGDYMTEENTNIPGGVYNWDGKYHTWEFVFDTDYTYINISFEDGDGKETWYELGRCPTAPTYLERVNLVVSNVLRHNNKLTGDEPPQNFTIDFVEVLQKTSDVENVPEAFAGRPRLTGKAAPGGEIVCEADIPGVTDVRYYWFADDYPLTYGAENRYTVTEAEAGTAIRCLVKAVGARDMPEAWTERVAVAR